MNKKLRISKTDDCPAGTIVCPIGPIDDQSISVEVGTIGRIPTSTSTNGTLVTEADYYPAGATVYPAGATVCPTGPIDDLSVFVEVGATCSAPALTTTTSTFTAEADYCPAGATICPTGPIDDQSIFVEGLRLPQLEF